MANRQAQWPDNVSGRYYVDQTCIACGACEAIAPANFRMKEGGAYDFVCKQPATPLEESECLEALESCPVYAIGNDG